MVLCEGDEGDACGAPVELDDSVSVELNVLSSSGLADLDVVCGFVVLEEELVLALEDLAMDLDRFLEDDLSFLDLDLTDLSGLAGVFLLLLLLWLWLF